MKRLVWLGALAWSGCWNFDAALSTCLDGGGACFVDANAGAVDGGPVDAGTVDAGTFDAGTFDAGMAGDAGAMDAGPRTLSDVCLPGTGSPVCWEAPMTGLLNLYAGAWDGTSLWSVGERSQIITFTNGRFRNDTQFDSTDTLVSILSVPDAGLLAVGDGSKVLRWVDGGWTRESPLATFVNYGAAWTDGVHRVIAGTDCTSDYFVDSTWTTTAWASHTLPTGVCAKQGFIAGDFDDLWVSKGSSVTHRAGGSWAAFDAGAHEWFGAVRVGPGEVWLGASDGTLVQFIDGGAVFGAYATQFGIGSMLEEPDGGLLAVSDGTQNLLVKCSAFNSCQPVQGLDFWPVRLAGGPALTRYLLGDEGRVSVQQDPNAPRALDGRVDDDLEDFARDADGAVYAVGSRDGLWRRTTTGWSRVLTNLHSNAMTFDGPGRLWLAGFAGQMVGVDLAQGNSLTNETVTDQGRVVPDDIKDVVKLGTRLVAVGGRGFVALRDPAQGEWPTVFRAGDAGADLMHVTQVGAGAIAVGTRGLMVRIHEDGGVDVLDAGVSQDLAGVVGLGADDFVVMTAAGQSLRFSAGVVTPREFVSDAGLVTAFGGTSSTDLWAVTSEGTIATGNGSRRWLARRVQGSGVGLRTVRVEGADVFIGGESAILHVAR